MPIHSPMARFTLSPCEPPSPLEYARIRPTPRYGNDAVDEYDDDDDDDKSLLADANKVLALRSPPYASQVENNLNHNHHEKMEPPQSFDSNKENNTIAGDGESVDVAQGLDDVLAYLDQVELETQTKLDNMTPLKDNAHQNFGTNAPRSSLVVQNYKSTNHASSPPLEQNHGVLGDRTNVQQPNRANTDDPSTKQSTTPRKPAARRARAAAIDTAITTPETSTTAKTTTNRTRTTQPEFQIRNEAHLKELWKEIQQILETAGAVLKDSHEQRESARKWTQGMKESTQKWVKEQHALIDSERKRAAAERQEAASSFQLQQSKLTRELQQTIEALRLELEEESKGREETESRLYEVIQQQVKRIEELEEQITRMKELESEVKSTMSQSYRSHDGKKLHGPSREAAGNNDNESSISKSTKPTYPPDHDHVTARDAVNDTPRRVESIFSDGSRVVRYRNGSEKQVFPDGKKVIRFGNGDIKTIFGNDTGTSYYYASTKTTHKTDSNGVETFEYPNEQVERHYPDGTKKITFADGTLKKILLDGTSETVYVDGIHVVEFSDGTKEITRYSY